MLLALLICFQLSSSTLAAGAEAILNGKLYNTLSEAFDAAASGDTIKLQRNAELTNFQLSRKILILDANGKSPLLSGSVSGSSLLILKNPGEYQANISCAFTLYEENGTVYFFGSRPAETRAEAGDRSGPAEEAALVMLSGRSYSNPLDALKVAKNDDVLFLCADWPEDLSYTVTDRRLVLELGGFRCGQVSAEAEGMLILRNVGRITTPTALRKYVDEEGSVYLYGAVPAWDASVITGNIQPEAPEIAKVCVLDGTEYAELSAALRKGIDGSQLVLLEDCAMASPVSVGAQNMFFDPAGHSWSGEILLDSSGILAMRDYAPGAGSGTVEAAFTFESAGWTWFYGSVDNITVAEVEAEYSGSPVFAGAVTVTALGQDVTAYSDFSIGYYLDRRCTVPAVGDDPSQAPTEPGSYWAMATMGNEFSEPGRVSILPPPNAEGEEEQENPGTLVPFLVLLCIILAVAAIVLLLLRRRKKN